MAGFFCAVGGMFVAVVAGIGVMLILALVEDAIRRSWK